MSDTINTLGKPQMIRQRIRRVFPDFTFPEKNPATSADM